MLEKAPKNFEALIWLGIVLRDLGRFDEAYSLFERARQVQPNSMAPYVGLLRSRKVEVHDLQLLEKAAALLTACDGTEEDRRQLSYSVAKAYDDLEEYAKAASWFESANALAYKLQKPRGFDRTLYEKRINGMLETFTARRFEQLAPLGSPSRKPVFIIGMIRSGTTLIEQILSRHPKVHAGGELPFWIKNGPTTVDLSAHVFNARMGATVRDRYLQLMNHLGPGFEHVTDKMPLNYMLLGLIHLLFPQAPIIHCRRSPADTCLSIWMTPFWPAPDFAYDRSEIVFAYRLYERAMKTWKAALPPGRLLEIDYEILVTEPEPTIRKLLGHCGLEWDETCLNPGAGQRAVETPSRWQVRQPFYRSSIGKAEHYREWLGDLAELH